MSADPAPQPQRSLPAILFDLILLAFSATIVISSLGLRPGVGTVPLIVGIPTGLGMLIILVLDLFPQLRPARAADGSTGGAPLQAFVAAAKDAEDDLEIADDPNERRRQGAFSAWALGVVVLATLTSFYVAIPVALLGLFITVRVPWRMIILTLSVTLAIFYGLFVEFLHVHF